MRHQYVSLHVHLVWAVNQRQPLVSVEVQAWMWPLLAQKARDLGSQFVVVGGVEDHVHVLTELPATVSVAELVRRLKGASSKIASDRGLPTCRGRKAMPHSPCRAAHATPWRCTFATKRTTTPTRPSTPKPNCHDPMRLARSGLLDW